MEKPCYGHCHPLMEHTAGLTIVMITQLMLLFYCLCVILLCAVSVCPSLNLISLPQIDTSGLNYAQGDLST